MHTVVVRKDLADEHPDVVKAVYKGFCDAKDAMTQKYLFGMIFNIMSTMFPSFSELLAEDRGQLGENWWPYGVKDNRAVLDAYPRWHGEQGLSKRRMTCEEIFVPYLLDI